MNIIKEKPHFTHVCILGIWAIAFSLVLLSSFSWDLTARASRTILEFANVDTSYSAAAYTLFVRLLDGSNVAFRILVECSGLISVVIFGFIFIFTIGFLKGSLGTKIIWLMVGVCVGLIWNVSRLAFVIGVAYRFGLEAFFLFHYILSPSVDFIWIISVWTLAMSRLRNKKGKTSL